MMPRTKLVGEIPCALLPKGQYHIGTGGPDRFADESERPLHKVTLRSDVGIACDPVTERQYVSFAPDHVEESELPVVNVSWRDAQEFCIWLAGQTAYGWRLPSEAEWEIACRAGTTTPFSTGVDLRPEEANYYYDESGERIGPGRRTAVGTYPANAWGLRDMHGNVCEWCADAWHPSHDGSAFDGSPRAGDARAARVIRGGAWDLLPRLLRSSWREGLCPMVRRDNVGFRLAVTLA